MLLPINQLLPYPLHPLFGLPFLPSLSPSSLQHARSTFQLCEPDPPLSSSSPSSLWLRPRRPSLSLSRPPLLRPQRPIKSANVSPSSFTFSFFQTGCSHDSLCITDHTCPAVRIHVMSSQQREALKVGCKYVSSFHVFNTVFRDAELVCACCSGYLPARLPRLSVRIQRRDGQDDDTV
jgi:hypothetical protein